MKVVVTGSAGFVGQYVVRALLDAGHEVEGLDQRRVPTQDNRARHWIGMVDTTPTRDLHGVFMGGADAVVHLAAMADVNDVLEDPVRAMAVNVSGTARMLEAAKKAGVARFIFASTIWVYSGCPELSVNEATPLHLPDHLYTWTKMLGEELCRTMADFGFSTVVLRFGIPYGPGARENLVVPAFVSRALKGEPITVFGDGEQFRQFIHVEDLAQGVVKAVEATYRTEHSRLYNLDGKEHITINRLVDELRTHFPELQVDHAEARPGDFKGREVSSMRALADMRWMPTIPFTTGLADYVSHVRVKQEGRIALGSSVPG